MNTPEQNKQDYLNNRTNKHLWKHDVGSDGYICSVVRGDGVEFKLYDTIHSPGGRTSHKIVDFKIRQRSFSRSLYSGVEEIWIVYDQQSGGHWLSEILHGEVPKYKDLTLKLPLDNVKFIPSGDHPGAFGVKRRHDIHTGIDLYCNDGDEVYAISSGIVVDIQEFTGFGETPWWNDTYCIIVKQYKDGNYVVYGELTASVQVDDIVEQGTILGNVKQVLKKDKGVTSTSMLHLEYYDKSFDLNPVVWKLDEEKPECLLDPNVLLDNPNDLKYKHLHFEFLDAESAIHVRDLLENVLGIEIDNTKNHCDSYSDHFEYNVENNIIKVNKL